MKKPEPRYEQMDVPRLEPDIKDMNGQSTRRLAQCIDELSDLLDDDEGAPDCHSEHPEQ